jgi:hypothetical protein
MGVAVQAAKSSGKNSAGGVMFHPMVLLWSLPKTLPAVQIY